MVTNEVSKLVKSIDSKLYVPLNIYLSDFGLMSLELLKSTKINLSTFISNIFEKKYS